MEAKDIVAQEVKRQAKFGMEPSWEDFVIAGIEAGQRKVVEWIKAHPKETHYWSWHDWFEWLNFKKERGL